MVKGNENNDPEGGAAELERLCRLDRELAAEFDRKTGELPLAKAKWLALLREAEWRRRQGGDGGYSVQMS
jgi:hypothetical protein